LEEKSFKDCQKVADGLKEGFLKRYFGNNRKIHDFAEEALSRSRRDVALGINKAIKVLGSPSDGEVYKIINLIKAKHNWVEENRFKDADIERRPGESLTEFLMRQRGTHTL